MYADNKLLIAKNEDGNIYMLPKLVNRHGLVAGATGTGKTITLEVIAGSLSEAGVPVFLADIKGDISGMAKSGEGNDKLMAHIEKMGIKDFPFHAFPVRFWDVYGKMGHPVRTTISDMGPILLGRLLELTDVQEGVLNIAFKVADDKKLLLIDLKDLKSVLQYVGDNAKDLTTQYGNASKQSVGAILRALIALEDAGADSFFGEPNLQINDWMTKDADGKGMVNILHCVELFQKPILYSTFMLWLLSELYETLPEVGDLDKPKMVFFFDEAHLLFKDAPKVMVDKVEQVVKLIRSKGVGVYFITQNPTDIPDSVLSQLGNRVQHALRGYTPADQKSIKAAADSFRANPKFKTADVITDLGTGEALVSFLDEEGKPAVVQRAKVLPPANMMSALDDATRAQMIKASDLYGKYEAAVDRESAYEILTAQKAKDDEAAQAAQAAADEAKRVKEEAKAAAQAAAAQRRQPKSFGEKLADKAINSLEQQAIRSFTRGVMGLFKK